jgi:hypothetical protein
MKNRILSLLVILCLFYSCKKDQSTEQDKTPTEIVQEDNSPKRSITGLMNKRGLILNSDEATQGYVMFQPASSTKTFLINSDGQVVHQWVGEFNTMNSYLLENGNLIQLERDPDFPTFAAGGQAGRIREYDWDGKLVWDFEYANETELIHHDIEIMPNGNILAISYDAKTREEAIAAGMHPDRVPKSGIWPDKIIEIKPNGSKGGEVVWEWRMWDHLVQDIDSTKSNYANVADSPRKINLNVHDEPLKPVPQEQLDHMKKNGFVTSNATVDNRGSDITHCNAIAYNADLDQIVVSAPEYSEIFIIDHSTTTKEAKGSSGGVSGHGGDLLYRWGNPKNYDIGTEEDRKLYFQHDIKWIPKGHPGEGNLIVFNNDIPNPNNNLPSMWAVLSDPNNQDPQISINDFGNHSAVIEISPEMGPNGSYILTDKEAFGPSTPVWTYTAPDKHGFYSAFISGAQRLKNGNTLVTSGAKGRFFEVTPDSKIVWEYWNPYVDDYKLPDGSPAQPTGPFLFGQFRSTHFTPDFLAFSGKELKPITPQPDPFIFIPPPPPPPKEPAE